MTYRIVATFTCDRCGATAPEQHADGDRDGVRLPQGWMRFLLDRTHYAAPKVPSLNICPSCAEHCATWLRSGGAAGDRTADLFL